MPLRSITFWYHAPTVHQFGLIRTLAAKHSQPVTIATFTDLSVGRRRMGWTVPDFGEARRVRIADDRERDAFISARSTRDDLHLFSGVRGFSTVHGALRSTLRTHARVGILAIRPDPRGVRGTLRRVRYWMDARGLAGRIDMFLALGETGVSWYKAAGYEPDRIYEFGNFSDPPPPATCAPHSPFRLLFIGSLLNLKGVHVLLKALTELKERSWEFHVVGDGEPRARLQKLASDFGIADRVRWRGFLPHQDALIECASADTLVLPSLQDGWGSVVNEALLCGTPVVCSGACGAAAVVTRSPSGTVVPPNDPRALSAAIRSQLDLGPPSPARRHSIATWATCVTPDQGAVYFDAIVAHALDGARRPVPPWQITR